LTDEHRDRVLCVVACGAGLASDLHKFVELVQADGWTVFIIATPAAVPFLDVPRLEAITGIPIRSEYRAPGEPRANAAGKADAVVVIPATFNTINKLAAGVSDNYALGVLAEAIGMGVPTFIVPFINTALAARLPLRKAVDALRAEGLFVLHGDGAFVPHSPGQGDRRSKTFPWDQVGLAIDAERKKA